LPVKVLLKQLALKGYSATGRYKPFDAGDLAQFASETVKFSGDIPRGAGTVRSQGKLDYRLPRVPQEVHDLLYTPRGMAWTEGTLHQRYSLQEPALRDLYERPTEKPTAILPTGILVQAETPYTYGDWVSEHLCTLASAMPLTAPLLMPRHLMGKSYVRRDLSMLGIESYTVESTVLVKKALVLPKRRCSHYFTREEVSAVRRAFHVDFTPPRPGSILYLSREGEHAEAIQRDYPSETISTIMSNLGVRVVRTRETSLDQYRELAPEAETVIADHGAAMCNLLFWNTKYIIECFTDDWWTNCFLMLARALGIQCHALVRVSNTAADNIRERIIQEMDSFKAS
jgi:Glycosyltransferase 61